MVLGPDEPHAPSEIRPGSGLAGPARSPTKGDTAENFRSLPPSGWQGNPLTKRTLPASGLQDWTPGQVRPHTKGGHILGIPFPETASGLGQGSLLTN